MPPKKQNTNFLNMKLKDQTTYKDTYGGGKEPLPQFVKDHEIEMKKTCVQKMQKGSLARHI